MRDVGKPQTSLEKSMLVFFVFVFPKGGSGELKLMDTEKLNYTRNCLVPRGLGAHSSIVHEN